MKLKSLMLCVGLLTWTSCANQVEGFSIANFYPLGEGCDDVLFREERIAPNGYLDVAAGRPQFFVGIRVIGGQNIVQNEVVVGQTVLERANRNVPVITQQVVSYRLSNKKAGATAKPYLINLSIPFSDEGEVFGAFQLISPELGLALDALAPSPGTAPSNVIETDFVDISADVEFKGEFSASRHAFTTGVLTFPIRAYRSSPGDCGADGFIRFAEGQATGAIDVCNYVGQTTSQLIQPPPPSCCLRDAMTGQPLSGGC